MIEFYINCNLIVQTLIACTFTFLITTLGAAIVFFFKKVNNTVLDAMLGLSGGVMIAASFFSLLKPAIEDAMLLGMIPWFIVSIGFLCGALFLIVGDAIFDKTLNKKEVNKKEKTSLKRSIMLIVSITLHNIPEGISISVPIYYSTKSKAKALLYTFVSGISEPLGAIIAYLFLAPYMNDLIMSILLSSIAGIMIAISIYELIPASLKYNNTKRTTLYFLIGSIFMMICHLFV